MNDEFLLPEEIDVIEDALINYGRTLDLEDAIPREHVRNAMSKFNNAKSRARHSGRIRLYPM